MTQNSCATKVLVTHKRVKPMQLNAILVEISNIM